VNATPRTTMIPKAIDGRTAELCEKVFWRFSTRWKIY
jgi:hypothetical protein